MQNKPIIGNCYTSQAALNMMQLINPPGKRP